MLATRRKFVLSAALVPALSSADSRYRAGIPTNTIGGWERDPFIGFREAREVGYHFVESFAHYFPEYYPGNPQQLRNKLDEIGVALITLSNAAGPTEMHFEDSAKHEKILEDHLRLARYIKSLGCDHLKINCGARRPQGTTPEDLQNIAKVL